MRADHEAYSAQVQRIQAALRRAGWGTRLHERTVTHPTHADVLNADAPQTRPQPPPTPVFAALRERDVNATACLTSRKTCSLDATGVPQSDAAAAPTRPAEAPRLFMRLMGDTGRSGGTETVAAAASRDLFSELLAEVWGCDAASARSPPRTAAACTMHSTPPAEPVSSRAASVSSQSSSAAAAALPRTPSRTAVVQPHLQASHVYGPSDAASRAAGRRPATRIASAVGRDAATTVAPAAAPARPLVCGTRTGRTPSAARPASSSSSPPPSPPASPAWRKASSCRLSSRGVGANTAAAAVPTQRQRRLLRAVQWTEAALQRGSGASGPLLVRLRSGCLGRVLQTLTDAHGRTMLPCADALTRAEVVRLRDRLVRELLASHATPCAAQCRSSPPPPHAAVEGRSTTRPLGSSATSVGERSAARDACFRSVPRRRTPSASPVATTSCASVEVRERSSSMSGGAASREASRAATAVEEDPYAVSLQRFAQEAAALRAAQERRRLRGAA